MYTAVSKEGHADSLLGHDPKILISLRVVQL